MMLASWKESNDKPRQHIKKQRHHCSDKVLYSQSYGFGIWASLVAQIIKNLPQIKETQVWTLAWKILWQRKWLFTSAFLPGKSHGQRSLMAYNPCGRKELDMTEQLTHRYGFCSSHMWMWELDHKEGWALKNWWFQIVVLEKTLECPLDCKQVKLSQS